MPPRNRASRFEGNEKSVCKLLGLQTANSLQGAVDLREPDDRIGIGPQRHDVVVLPLSLGLTPLEAQRATTCR
jgi:hypothetical protein